MAEVGEGSWKGRRRIFLAVLSSSPSQDTTRRRLRIPGAANSASLFDLIYLKQIWGTSCRTSYDQFIGMWNGEMMFKAWWPQSIVIQRWYYYCGPCTLYLTVNAANMFVSVKLHGLKCARWNQVLVLHFSQQNAASRELLLPEMYGQIWQLRQLFLTQIVEVGQK